MKKHAEVFILLGQSNAVGHAIPMAAQDRICKPLSHVFGLSRAQNQLLHPEHLCFSGYTSAGMNLGEEQDHTYSLANCLAAQWERAAEADPGMPDLYLIQIAIGAQGIGPGFMWNPNYPEQLTPGTLGTVNISLYPFTKRILSLLKPSFDQMGVGYHILGVHWRGGEEDTAANPPETEIPLLRPIYRKLFDMFRLALGEMPKTVLYQIEYGSKIDERTDADPELMQKNKTATNQMFCDFSREYLAVSLFHPFSLSLYRPDYPKTWGIFSEEDGVHYSGAANAEIAARIIEEWTIGR